MRNQAWSTGARILAGLCPLVLVAGGIAFSQTTRWSDDPDLPVAEFHLARMVVGGGGLLNSRGFGVPYWAIDYPLAEINFLPALGRLTNLNVAPAIDQDIRHFELTDDRLFNYPFLWLQQPAQAYWNPTDRDAAALREYLARGGFLLIDDFHGPAEYDFVQRTLSRVFPDRELREIPDNDPMMSVFYDLSDRVQIPGERHLTTCNRDQFNAVMSGDPYWLGIYDDEDRLMVGVNYNIDMGDGWEHADDPCYPAPMTGQAYPLAINYILYAMTH
jgi:hypothetical protein